LSVFEQPDLGAIKLDAQVFCAPKRPRIVSRKKDFLLEKENEQIR